MSDLFAYLAALFSHWLWLMSAGPFLIDRLVSWLSPNESQWHVAAQKMRSLSLSIMMIGVFLAGFLAWNDEHQKSAGRVAERHLSDRQKSCLADAIKKDKALIPNIAFTTSDTNTGVYFMDFLDAIEASGERINVTTTVITDPARQHDVMIGIKDADHPPERGIKFRSALRDCEIYTHFVKWTHAFSDDAFDLFIAPPRN